MKKSNVLELLLEKYKLTSPVSYFDNRKILKSKRKTLSKILKSEKYDSAFVSAAVFFDYLLSRIGINTTPAVGARTFAAAMVVSFIVIISASLTVFYNYRAIMQPMIAVTEIQEYQKGFILMAEGNAKIIRDNKEIPAVKAKDRIITKDEIITGADGTMLFQMEKSLVRVMPESACTAEIGLKTKSILLRNGTVLCNVRRLAQDEKFSVITPNAEAAVVGTRFSVTYENETTTVTVTEGVVRVTNLKNNDVIRVEEGFTAEIGMESTVRKSEKNDMQLLRKFGKLEYIDNVIGKSDEEMIKLRETILALDSEKEEKKEEDKIKTLEDIKQKYGKLEEVQLYNGRKFTGAIISRGSVFTIVTTSGIKKIKSKDVKNVRIIK